MMRWSRSVRRCRWKSLLLNWHGLAICRKTNNANNEVYLFDNRTSPLLMHEIGRIRELTFRHAGGGTGKALDLDEYDLDPDHPQKQLIIWDPDNREIIGGYRFIFPGHKEKDFSADRFASSSYFTFSRKFIRKYLPHTMELGRSFVRPEYQSAAMGRKSLFLLITCGMDWEPSLLITVRSGTSSAR